MRCGIISSCQSAATSEIVLLSIVEQRYIKYRTFTFYTRIYFCQFASLDHFF